MDEDRLISLYNERSKHSHYQIMANRLVKLIPGDAVETNSRFEGARLDYILKHIPCKDMSLADIGGNTGYFTFELVDRGVKSVLFFEGNHQHCSFVREAAKIIGWDDRIRVNQRYVEFDSDFASTHVDLCLLLNVLHHYGEDYGNPHQSADAAKRHVLQALSSLAHHTQLLVFQIGFNWKGNRNLPLFTNGTKREVIDFVRFGTEESWVIQHIGIAQLLNNRVIYEDLNSQNIERQDSLGEFLNRPLFILKSRLDRKKRSVTQSSRTRASEGRHQ
jgi:hypothetical protein